MWIKSLLAVAALSVPVLAVPAAAQACGMPADIILKQAVLGIAYPNAMHVTGARWRAQQAGLLDMPDPKLLRSAGEERVALEAAAHIKALEALDGLGRMLVAASRQRHAISIVLVEGMNWARFTPDPESGVSADEQIAIQTADATGDDLVVVFTRTALQGVRRGSLTLAQAEELGLLQLHGSDAQITAFRSDFAEVGKVAFNELPRGGSALRRFATYHIQSIAANTPSEQVSNPQ